MSETMPPASIPLSEIPDCVYAPVTTGPQPLMKDWIADLDQVAQNSNNSKPDHIFSEGDFQTLKRQSRFQSLPGLELSRFAHFSDFYSYVDKSIRSQMCHPECNNNFEATEWDGHLRMSICPAAPALPPLPKRPAPKKRKQEIVLSSPRNVESGPRTLMATIKTSPKKPASFSEQVWDKIRQRDCPLDAGIDFVFAVDVSQSMAAQASTVFDDIRDICSRREDVGSWAVRCGVISFSDAEHIETAIPLMSPDSQDWPVYFALLKEHKYDGGKESVGLATSEAEKMVVGAYAATTAIVPVCSRMAIVFTDADGMANDQTFETTLDTAVQQAKKNDVEIMVRL